MEKFLIVAVMAFFIYQLYRVHTSGGLKALFDKSRAAPQHWDLFAFLMIGVLFLVWVMTKI